MKFDDLFKLEVGKFMHHFKSKKLPNSFNEYFHEVGQSRSRVTRASNRKDLTVVRCKKKIGEKSIKLVGAKLWNELPSELKSTEFSNFKNELKNCIFANFQHINSNIDIAAV